jgi:acyl carrier protein
MTADERAQIIERLKPILARVSNGRAQVDRLREDARIIEDIGLASLALLELRFDLEAEWNTSISDEEAISLRTIRDIVDVVREKSKGDKP